MWNLPFAIICLQLLGIVQGKESRHPVESKHLEYAIHWKSFLPLPDLSDSDERRFQVTYMKDFKTICDAFSSSDDDWGWPLVDEFLLTTEIESRAVLMEWGDCPYDINRIKYLLQAFAPVNALMLYGREELEQHFRKNLKEFTSTAKESKVDIIFLPFGTGSELKSLVKTYSIVSIDLNEILRKEKRLAILLSLRGIILCLSRLITLIFLGAFLGGVYLASSTRYSMEIDLSGFAVYRVESNEVKDKSVDLLTQEQFDTFSEVEYLGSPQKKCQSTCSICLEDFVKGENIRVLPCDHIFHSKCVGTWLTKRSSQCPLCKEEFHKIFQREEDKKISKKKLRTIIQTFTSGVRRRATDSPSSILPR